MKAESIALVKKNTSKYFDKLSFDSVCECKYFGVMTECYIPVPSASHVKSCVHDL